MQQIGENDARVEMALADIDEIARAGLTARTLEDAREALAAIRERITAAGRYAPLLSDFDMAELESQFGPLPQTYPVDPDGWADLG